MSNPTGEPQVGPHSTPAPQEAETSVSAPMPAQPIFGPQTQPEPPMAPDVPGAAVRPPGLSDEEWATILQSRRGQFNGGDRVMEAHDFVQDLPPEDPYAPTTWKKGASTEMDLTVPSGNKCRVRKIGGMQMFLEKGMVPNSLMPTVMEHMNDKREVDMAKVSEDFLEDPAKLAAIIELSDSVVCNVVVAPRVLPVPHMDVDVPERGLKAGDPVPFDMRDETLLFVDEVDMEDKMFIFQWAVGGSKDVERFRERSQAAVEDVQAVQGLDGPAE